MTAACMVPGDRALPTLHVRPHLRAVDDRVAQPAPGTECPLYSRIGGQYPVFDGFLPMRDALALLVAGEA